MKMVVLMSGGLDSAVLSVLAKEEGVEVFPLFVNFGQLAADREWNSCERICRERGFSDLQRLDFGDYGRLIPSGLTSQEVELSRDVFLPGRNLLLLTAASAYAFKVGASVVAIGLLSEDTHLFPDQTGRFLETAEAAVHEALGRRIKVVAPLMQFCKAEIVGLAEKLEISGTYSCHSGDRDPCGECVSCQELAAVEDR